MSSAQHMLQSLKHRLKSEGISYKQVATELQLSEASVKRMFSQGHISLARLESICRLAHWDLIDLAHASKANQTQIDGLTLEQEQHIAADLTLLLITVSVINGFSMRDLQSQYHLTEPQCIQKLIQLDKLQLIELLPGNRIKLRISPRFHWQPQGPIQQFFLEHVVQDFFNSQFAQADEKLLVLNGLLTNDANQQVQEAMASLAEHFTDQAKQAQPHPMEDKKGNTLVVALRRWRFEQFERFYKGD